MQAFISYSHNDNDMLESLHKHLSQLRRDNIISTWTDNDIFAGSEVHKKIRDALKQANLFIALLSPDYIDSRYCYEKEFAEALKMQEEGRIIIIPIVIEPCDWLSTPFQKFKALPKDGKAISTWENKNTAFLDVIQNLRSLINNQDVDNEIKPNTSASPAIVTRNYRVQRDFDSIEKMEFTEKTFMELKEHLKRYIGEVTEIENIKSRVLKEDSISFECLLVNRNKIATESKLTLSIKRNHSRYSSMNSDEEINYSIKSNSRNKEGNYYLNFDEYHLYWSDNNFNFSAKSEFTSKDITDKIWDEWLESVGIL